MFLVTSLKVSLGLVILLKELPGCDSILVLELLLCWNLEWDEPVEILVEPLVKILVWMVLGITLLLTW